MGGALPSDKRTELIISPPKLNVDQTKNYTALILAKGIQTQFFQKIFQYENYKKIQVTYKFLPNIFIHLELNKQKSKQEPGYPINLGGEIVYGYKFKKNEKNERIRPDKVYFRRKIFISAYESSGVKPSYREKLKNNLKNRGRSREDGRRQSRQKSIGSKEPQVKKHHQNHKEQLLRKLAQLKLMSKLDCGIKIGRAIDGTDGSLTEHYIEFYSQLAISKGRFQQREAAERDRLCDNLQKKGLKVHKQSVSIAYSVFQKGYILKQLSKPGNSQSSDQNQNRSIKFIVRQFEEEINKAILKLDGITNMMTAIQNYLAQRDVEKAMQKFEENMANMEEADRLVYAQQMAFLLAKYNHYKSYQREVSSYISSSRSSSVADSRNLSQSRFNGRIKSDNQEDSTDFEGVRHSNDLQNRLNSPMASPRSTHALKFSDFQGHNKGMFSSSDLDALNDANKSAYTLEPNYLMWESAQQRLKNSILDNDKSGINESLTCLKNLGVLSTLEVEIYFAQVLMENAKTKHAKLICQRILHTKKGGYHEFLKSEVYSIIGYLSYSKGFIAKALSHYQNALTIKFRFRSYSRKTVLIFNNMAVLSYCLQKYQNSLLYLHRAMKLGEYCPDYELLIRSNYAMALAEQGQLKQAKLQMYKTYRNVEPYSNNQIVCKFYSNLGYFDLADNLLDKAKASFDLACQIEQKFLIPNGYKPSVILHNNYAMYHYKKSEWRKAANHLQKIQNQISEIHGIKCIQIHFNFGKIYKQLYNYDTAIRHFSQCRYLLLKMQQKLINKYREKIQQQVQKIEAQRIDEVSQQSSYANKFSKISRSMVSQKHIQSRIRS